MTTFSLDSVIRLEAGMTQLVQQTDHPLAKLHMKCWDKDLAQYERPLSDLGEESTQDSEDVVSAFVGEQKGKAKEESSHEGSTPDKATTEDDDMVDDWRELDDIIPGTCILDLRPMEFELRILIRADYIRMFDGVRAYFSKRRLLRKARVAIVTGQPGIGESPNVVVVNGMLTLSVTCAGKTIWNLYAIARRLSQSEPTIWLHKTSYYLFVESGVYTLPKNFELAVFPEVIWVFVDSDGNKEGIPAHLTVHNASNLFIVYTTSPSKQRWSNIRNVVSCKEFMMNPWTRKEIHRAWVIPNIARCFANVSDLLRARLVMHEQDLKKIDDVYDRLGPTPRLCIDKVIEDELAAYERDVRNALRTQSTDKLVALTREAENLEPDFMSNKLCLLRRNDVNDVSADNINVTPITDHIGSRLALQIRNAHVEEQLKLYNLWATTPSFRGMTGTLFEGYCHGVFQVRIRLQLHDMIRREGGSEKSRPQWQSIYCVVHNAKLETQRQEALRRFIEVDIQPVNAYEYHDSELEGLLIRENVYYIPFKGNEVGLDSFILSGGYLYVFQMTGGKNHKIKDGMFALLDQCANVPNYGRWRYVFVIPDDVEVLTTPYSAMTEALKLKLFCARMVMGPKETSGKQSWLKRTWRKVDKEGSSLKKVMYIKQCLKARRARGRLFRDWGPELTNVGSTGGGADVG
jgi:hypothetical protein